MNFSNQDLVSTRRAPPAAARVSAAALYGAYFGLHEAPFALTPDTRFFYAHAACHEALNTLLVATRTGEGFMKVVGEVGTGKTLLCRQYLSLLGEDFLSAYIPNPYLEPMTLLLAIADELGVRYPIEPNQHELLKALTRFLLETYGTRRCSVVLCLDEAHAMPRETLEALRLLSNLETQRRKLLQIVLFGQPELDTHLNDPSLRQLRQRIAFSCRLAPLKKTDIPYYLAHRLSIAGYAGQPLFSARESNRVYRATQGVPRLVNIIAHKAMIAAYGRGRRVIEAREIAAAIADTETLREQNLPWPQSTPLWRSWFAR